MDVLRPALHAISPPIAMWRGLRDRLLSELKDSEQASFTLPLGTTATVISTDGVVSEVRGAGNLWAASRVSDGGEIIVAASPTQRRNPGEEEVEFSIAVAAVVSAAAASVGDHVLSVALAPGFVDDYGFLDVVGFLGEVIGARMSLEEGSQSALFPVLVADGAAWLPREIKFVGRDEAAEAVGVRPPEGVAEDAKISLSAANLGSEDDWPIGLTHAQLSELGGPEWVVDVAPRCGLARMQALLASPPAYRVGGLTFVLSSSGGHGAVVRRQLDLHPIGDLLDFLLEVRGPIAAPFGVRAFTWAEIRGESSARVYELRIGDVDVRVLYASDMVFVAESDEDILRGAASISSVSGETVWGLPEGGWFSRFPMKYVNVERGKIYSWHPAGDGETIAGKLPLKAKMHGKVPLAALRMAGLRGGVET